MAALHPDRNGDAKEFIRFVRWLRRAQKGFDWHLQTTPVPRPVKFTPAREVWLAKRAAQARAWRKRNRKHWRATLRARYQRLKAAGLFDTPEHKQRAIANANRYRKRHKRKVTRMMREYRHAHPEKVRQWKENYKISAALRGVKRKPRPETPATSKRMQPGTPESERRSSWRKNYQRRTRRHINAMRRKRYKRLHQKNGTGGDNFESALLADSLGAS
jgi:hypothetical protein